MKSYATIRRKNVLEEIGISTECNCVEKFSSELSFNSDKIKCDIPAKQFKMHLAQIKSQDRGMYTIPTRIHIDIDVINTYVKNII